MAADGAHFAAAGGELGGDGPADGAGGAEDDVQIAVLRRHVGVLPDSSLCNTVI
jgi:hypothetical protein